MSHALEPSPFPPRDSSDAFNSKLPPPIYDPYLVPLAQPKRGRLSVLAVCSVLAALLLGPPGSIAAIVLGWAAARDIDRSRPRKRGHMLASVGVALGIVATIGWILVAPVAAMLAWEQKRTRIAAEEATPPAPVKDVPVPSATAPGAPVDPPRPTTNVEPGGTVPKSTLVHREGAVMIVDVGVSARSLADELSKQLTEGKALDQTLVVMTTRDPCDPCRGVDRSLSDPLLQAALAKVRLVRVDIDVFKDDLDQLKIPRQRYPGFFLLAPDLMPRDGIDGGEWDEDIPVNIAPVLGPFVRGKYASRRQNFRPLPGSGIAL